MSVTYESAMATLTSMFGDVDKEVIAMILQANGGHMEKTVENLLAMSGGAGGGGAPPRRAQPPQQQQSPARASQPLPQMMHSPYQSPYPQQPGMQQYQQYPPAHPIHPPPQPFGQPQIIDHYIPGPQQQQPYSPQQQPSPQAYRRVEEHKQGPPPAHPSHAPPSAAPQRPPAPQPDLMIPDDFMRPPSFFQAIFMGAPIRQPLPQQQQQQQPQYAPADIAHASPASAASQIEQDHLLAQMLQDEQFMQDLANNPERYRNVQPQPQQLAAPGPAAAAAGSANASPSIRPQPAPIADAKLSAPAAHPHPDFAGGDARARSASGGNQSGPIWTPPPAAAAAGAGVALGSEPLNPRLHQLEHGGPSAVTKEQQSSFAKRWSSLTSAAREKLSRISERFKKDPAHDADMDGGGAYKSMPLSDGPEEPDAPSQQRRPVKLNDIRFAEANDEPDPSANANFLSAEEAASMQASYRTPAAASKSKAGKKKNALLVDDDEADPFGSGANGSGDDDDDSSNPNASFKYLQRGNSIDSVSQASSSGVSVLPQMSRTISGVEANNAEDDDDRDEEGESEGYRPPRMQASSSSSIKPERIILSPSQFQHGGSAASSSAQKHGRKGSAAVVDPPSDDEDKPSLPAQRKRSSVSGAAPGRGDSKPLLQDLQDM